MIYFVYGITDCPACLRACADLMEANLEYVFIETDFAKNYRDELKEQYEWPSFPIVLTRTAKETLIIGGYTELREHLKLHPLDKNFACNI
tara:strand:- start:1199 stop:1468 length:270 start_codon:yes stop_codon:yes gene_type:complete